MQLFTDSLPWGEEKKVSVDFVKKDSKVPYLSLELENTVISTFGGGGHDGDRPMES